MKKIGFSCFITLFLLWGCKKKEESPIVFPQTGLNEFRVEGVPQANVKIEESGTIRVQLPADYKGGNRIKVFFRDWKETLAKPQSVQSGWKGNEIVFEGRTVRIEDQIIQVVPGKPLEFLPKGMVYEYTPYGSNNYVALPVKNWGSIGKTSPDDSLSFRLIDKKTGQVIYRSEVDIRQPAPDGDTTLVDVKIPMFPEAGDYQFVLRRRGQDYVGPDLFRVVYGQPTVDTQGGGGGLLLDGATSMAEIRGQNLLPGHDYQMVLSNDFGPPQKFVLTPKNPGTLTTQLPASLPEGNYLLEIYIDGKASKVTDTFGIDRIFTLQESPNLPRLLSLTDSSQEYTVNRLNFHFKSITNFKRAQSVLAITFPGNSLSWDFIKLNLTEIDTKKELVLDNMGKAAGGILYFRPIFEIPLDTPPGRYEAKFSMKSNEGKVVSSARYHRIITIE